MKSTRVLLIYFAIALIFYFPSWQSGLTWDFIGWLVEYKTEGIQGFLHLFNDRGLHPLYQAAFFGVYKLFGAHPFGWFLLFLILHVFNATLSFIFFSRLFKKCGVLNSNAVAFFGALFFLVSPYQTEVVVWKATIHYLTTTACILSALIFSLDYAQKGDWKYLATVFLLYFTGLFSLEIAISLPFLLCLIVLLPRKGIFGKVTAREFLLRLVMPQLLMIPIFFLLSKLLLGRWVAHYGARAHLNFSDVLIVGNFNRYLLKYLVFMQFFGYPIRVRFYEFVANSPMVHWFVILYAMLALLFWYCIRRYPYGQLKIFSVLLLMSVAGMMTTVNLYLNYLINVENDRFGYFGSIFILMMLAFLAFQLNKYLRFWVLATFSFFSIKFLEVNIANWKQSAIVIDKLTSNFERFNSGNIFILNTPDNFHGANVFRNFGLESPIAETIFVRGGKDMRAQVRDVLYYNMENIADSVKIAQVGKNSLKISFAQWGNWWWRHGIGASDYENNLFSVKMTNGSYIITFKKRSSEDIILYQCGTEWRVFKGFG